MATDERPENLERELARAKRRNRWLLVPVCFLAFLSLGCDDSSATRAQIQDLESQCATLRKNNEGLQSYKATLGQSILDLESQKATMQQSILGLKQENQNLKATLAAGDAALKTADAQGQLLRQEVASLTLQLAEVKKTVAALVGAVPGAAAGVFPPPPAPSKPRDEFAITEARNAIAELETRIVALQAEINQGRSRVASLVRATVDVPMVVPPDGRIMNGMIYNYKGLAIGPAVKTGDFRSIHDREKAVADAKAQVLPLETELKALKDEQEKAKKRLAELMGGGK